MKNNKESDALLRQRVRELAVLNKLGRRVSATLSLEEVVQAAVDGIWDPIEPDLVLVFVKEGEDLVLKGCRWDQGENCLEDSPGHIVGECLCGRAVNDGNPVYSPDIHDDERCTRDECRRAGYRSFAALPLKGGAETIGVVGVGSREFRNFREQADFLEVLAAQIAIGLQNALLHRQVKQHLDELEERVSERTRELRLSEEKLRIQFNGIPVPTYIWQWKDEDFILINHNYAAEAITRGGIAQFIGRTASEMYEATMPEILTDLNKCRYTKDLHKREMSYRFMSTGEDRYLGVTYAFVPPDLIVVHTEDITQRKRSEEALKRGRDLLEVQVEERTRELTEANRQLLDEIDGRKAAEEELGESEALYRNVFDTIVDSVFIADMDGLIVDANTEACRMYGYTREELIGMHAMRLITEEYHPTFERYVTDIKETGTFTGETVDVRKDGAMMHVEVRGSMIRIKKKPHLLALVRDITRLKQEQEMLIQNEKMMTFGGMAAGMAHEINNPLAGILQGLQVIDNRLSPEFPANLKIAGECGTSLDAIKLYLEKRKILEFLESSRELGQRAAAIVKNMLDFSRKSDSGLFPQRLEKLLDKTIALAENDYDLKKKYDFRSIDVVREYREGLPDIYCEGAKIQHVFLNLLKNAAQALTEAKIPSPRIIVRIDNEKDEMARIEIEDNGPGMPENIRRRIFEPFFTTKEVGMGTGLGLSLSYFIITESHKGTMEVRSVPGKSTTFIIRVPFSS